MKTRNLTLLTLAVLLSACQTESGAIVQNSPKLSDLAGSEWGLEGSPDVFLAFKVDGRVNGSGGCNNFFSDYQFQGQGPLNFGQIASTKKMCPPDIMDGERAFFNGLEATKGAEVSHLTLQLRDKDGTPLLTLQRRDWD